jgi:hypothetical protein
LVRGKTAAVEGEAVEEEVLKEHSALCVEVQLESNFCLCDYAMVLLHQKTVDDLVE